SCRSWIPSPSASTFPLHARPRFVPPPCTGTCVGLYTSGQLSLEFTRPSKSMSSKSHASPTPSASESSWLAFDTAGQLSQIDPTPSASTRHVPPPPQFAFPAHGLPISVPLWHTPSSWPGL